MIDIDARVLDALLPMHLRFDSRGIICHAAPGLTRLMGDRSFVAGDFFDVFTITSPAGIHSVDRLLECCGGRLRVKLSHGRQVRLKGNIQALTDGGGLVDLALDLVELSDLGGAPLTNTDFSPTDPTVDMLYLIEANQAAMSESRRLIERLQGAKSHAETQAFTDALTGLANRRALDRIIGRYISTSESFALTQVDLDYFKTVNDSFGHAAGDAVLRAAAFRLREATRQTDTVVRIGGDEFVILFRGLTDRDTLDRIANRIIESLERPVAFEGKDCRISASLGTAITTDYLKPDIDRMMSDADRALYSVKKTGRAAHRIATPSGETVTPAAQQEDAA